MSATKDKEHFPCNDCGKLFLERDLVSVGALRTQLAEQIERAHPDWDVESRICRADLAKFRRAYVESMISSEKHEQSSLEREVLRSLAEHDLLSKDVETQFEQQWTFGERMADHIASFGGSWAFLLTFGAFLVVWVGANSLVLYWHPVDPYPYILLNLMLSCLAAMQAPIIMMSQNRQEAKDRMRSQNDYQVNLKAELEIRNLHEKVDHLLQHQWDRLMQIQELQMDLLTELEDRK